MCSITINQPHPWSFRPHNRRRRHTTLDNIHITCHCGSTSCRYHHHYPRYTSTYPLTGSIYNINHYPSATTTPTTPYYPHDYTTTTGTRTRTRTHDTTLYRYERIFPSSSFSSPAPRPAPRPQPAAPHRPRCRACEQHACRCVGRYSFDMDKGWVDEWEAWRERERREVERFVGGCGGMGRGMGRWRGWGWV